MKKYKTLFHPILVFILSLLALGTSLFLYIHWYLQASEALHNFIAESKMNPDQFMEIETWVIIMILSILVAMIIFGMVLIFTYYQKLTKLYKHQQNFINGFTHELKTPVTSLNIFLDTFKKHELPRETFLKYVEYMKKDLARLKINILRILELSKLESGHYKAQMERVEIISFIDGYFNNNRYLFQSCELFFNELLHEKKIYCHIDIISFEMLLNNIIGNAVKYNNSDVPRINISISYMGKQNKYIEIAFKDNGIGIDRDELKNIFKKFYQVGSSENMSAKGNGVGLYLVYHIAKIHGGKIRCESPGLGQGSTFILTLPSVVYEK